MWPVEEKKPGYIVCVSVCMCVRDRQSKLLPLRPAAVQNTDRTNEKMKERQHKSCQDTEWSAINHLLLLQTNPTD